MERVTFISAGAGSGKTHSLTQQIVKFVKSGVCSADEIIVTTFTRTAAAELREKVRSALYKEGLYDEAVQIDNAAIGTIHSIAYQLVSRYWYLLGISADVRMIADEGQSFYVSQSLAGLPEERDLWLFRQMAVALNITRRNEFNQLRPDYDFWRDDLQSIIDQIDNFCVDAYGLECAKERSKQTVREVLNTHAAEVRLEDVQAAAERVLAASYNLRRGKPAIKQEQINEAITAFREELTKTDQLTLNVSAYIRLADIISDKMTNELATLCLDECDYFAALPDRILADCRTGALAESYIDTIFGLALKWQHKYKKFKDERQLLDFNDVQRYFAELLERPEISNEIKSRYKVALVDEFQDCSPQQVRFFESLSKLMVRSVWVGDVKQAIYNFRGTDTALVKNIIDTAAKQENGNNMYPLEHCWRSNETIVNLTNSVFIEVFKNSLEEKLVRLHMPPSNSDGYRKPQERELCHWHLCIGSADERHKALAAQIEELCQRENIAYKDIAILCRKNDDVAKYAGALRAAGIPYRVTADANSGEQNPVFDFLTALVSVAASRENSFSQALVAYYSEAGCTTAKILSDRLRCVGTKSENQWLSDVVLLRKISAMSKTIGNQSVASAVETLLIELNARDVIRRIAPAVDTYDYCQIFISAARTYEEQCSNLGLGCSLTGFVDFVQQRGLGQSGDENGVTVLTYHKSKGLEWKCVILTSLHKDQIDMGRIFSGVQVLRHIDRATITLFPTALFNICTATARERIAAHKDYRHLEQATFEESKRLMYVGMTRPKELLITTSVQTSRNTYGTRWLEQITGIDMKPAECQTESFVWFGNRFRFSRIEYAPANGKTSETEPAAFHILRTPDKQNDYRLRDVQPSRVAPSERLTGVELAGSFAKRLAASATNGSDALLGNCLHHMLCLYRDDVASADTAARVAAEYGVTLDSRQFTDSAKAFYGWLHDNYGTLLAIEREVPFRYRTDSGQIVSGEIDMICRTAEGDILIDYKSYPGAIGNITDPTSNFYAGKYSGQISLYEDAMLRAGRIVRDKLICYFSLGAVVRMIFK